MNEVGKYFSGVHLPEHPDKLKAWSKPLDESPQIVDTQTPTNDQVVNGWLITVKKDGEEKVFFRDQQGKIHPVIGAKFTPVKGVIKVRRLQCQMS